MKIVFFGTPAFAAEYLQALINEPLFDVIAVVAQPDEPVGRKQLLTPPPTKVLAQAHNIPVLQPTKLKDAEFPTADAYVVVAYGRIIPQRVLDIPSYGCINVHPSLLPQLRGPSPIIAAVAEGLRETGVTIMRLDADMDHGPLLAQTIIPMSAEETTTSLTQKVVDVGVPLLIDTLRTIEHVTPQEQDHAAATYCHLLTREDGRIDWQQPAAVIDAHVRAYNPWPGTFTTWTRNNAPLPVKIFAVRSTDVTLAPGDVHCDTDTLLVGTGTTALAILELQPASGKRMDTAAFVRGYGTGLHGA